jgi:hypothetical protein
MLARLDDALATLPEEQREVFLMREVMDMPFADIAAAVGASEPTVKSRMRYALEKLRGALADFRDTGRVVLAVAIASAFQKRVSSNVSVSELTVAWITQPLAERTRPKNEMPCVGVSAAAHWDPRQYVAGHALGVVAHAARCEKNWPLTKFPSVMS